jgi:hypothetical protein
VTRHTLAAAAACLTLLASACAGEPPAPAPPPAAPASAPYPVSAQGGTPATGPGGRYNRCERVFCLVHGENFFVDHFAARHVGWIVHDDERGDVFVARQRSGGPGFPNAKRTALRLCGSHLHPWLLGGGGSGPIRHTGFNRALGYGKGHWGAYGTRLDPCCPNGLGWGYLHAASGRQFRFHDTQPFRDHPERGWSRPFVARVASPS